MQADRLKEIAGVVGKAIANGLDIIKSDVGDALGFLIHHQLTMKL